MNLLTKNLKNAGVVILLPVLVYLLFFILSGGKYGSPSTIIMNFKQTLVPTLISYALCCNVLCNRMDLSAGSVVMLSSMIGARVVYSFGVGVVPFALIVVFSGIALGVISGAAYILLRVPAIVTALGVCMIYETFSNLTSISWVTAISGETTLFGNYPYCVIIFVIMAIVFYLLYNNTKFGYNVRACASSQQIAKNSGVDNRKTAFLCYVVSAVFLGVAALLRISIQGSIDTPQYMSSTNIIFNCLLGIYVGIALQRYCNIVIGIFVGNLILNMLTSGLMNMGLSSSLQDTASGAFLLLIMIYTYNHDRVVDYIKSSREKKALEKGINA